MSEFFCSYRRADSAVVTRPIPFLHNPGSNSEGTPHTVLYGILYRCNARQTEVASFIELDQVLASMKVVARRKSHRCPLSNSGNTGHLENEPRPPRIPTKPSLVALRTVVDDKATRDTA